MKLAQIADKGNDLDTLKQLRHKIAETIDESKSGRDIAALSRQLQTVMQQIAALEAEKEAAEHDTILDIVRSRHIAAVRDSRGRAIALEEDDYDEDD